VSSSNQIESIMQDAFEDVALLIGGAASLHQLEDQLVRILIRRLDHVRSRALARLALTNHRANRASMPGKPCPLHPAIEGFLLRNLDGCDHGLMGPRCAEDCAHQPNDGVAGEDTTSDATKGGAR
jgi:hypothetical protein